METQELVTISVGGKNVKVPRNTSTSQIRKISGLDQSHVLARSTEGLNKIVHGDIKVSDGDSFTVGRSFTKGSMDDSRLLNDLDHLSYVFNIEVDDKLNWVLIHDYGLPSGFNKETSDILLNVEGFPYLPPGNVYGVYMDLGLLYNGKKLPNYYDSIERTMFGKYWAWLCTGKMHWNSKIDNIFTFLMTLDIMLNEQNGMSAEVSENDEKPAEV
ncbi:E2/UBC family protein [Methanooceanicella nereidis]|uniref:E2/UBC family protein n=1 Tax=Methanooceanicella nereidis TaxID=2052831 RepID=UPI001E2D134D|nr:E2/UBC family protein [Methanocella sp. CWC-04]